MLKLSSKNFRKDEQGSSTVESVIVMGVFVTILMQTLETGFLMFRWVNLERAVDAVSRDIRVFGLAEKFTDSSHPDYQPGAAHEFIKAEICDEAQSLDNCEDSLMLEMVSLDISSGHQQFQLRAEIETKILSTLLQHQLWIQETEVNQVQRQ